MTSGAKRNTSMTKFSFTAESVQMSCGCHPGKWSTAVFLLLPSRKRVPVCQKISDGRPSEIEIETFTKETADRVLRSSGLSIAEADKVEEFRGESDVKKAEQRFFNEHDRRFN